MISAAVSYEFGRTEVREFDFPETAPDAGLLKVECCGVCGSDWPYYQKYPGTKGPLILGHEAVGHVDRLGADAARRFGVREGDRVALEEYLPCGHCKYCRSSNFRLCDATDTLNIEGTIRYGSTPISIAPSLWGGYSQYQVLHPNAVLHRVPSHVSATLATLALPLGNGIEWAYLQGRVSLGETVVIQGPGQQGLACVVAAKEAGAACIIVSGLSTQADERRLALAKKLGATHTVQADKVDIVQAVAQITNNEMADLVLDCSSGGPETIVAAVKLARKQGRVVFGGRKFRPIPDFDSDRLITQFLTIRGMRGHSYESVELAIQLIASGKYPLEEMCTHVFGLDQVNEALHTVGGKGLPGAIHCAVTPWST